MRRRKIDLCREALPTPRDHLDRRSPIADLWEPRAFPRSFGPRLAADPRANQGSFECGRSHGARRNEPRSGGPTSGTLVAATRSVCSIRLQDRKSDVTGKSVEVSVNL